MSARTDTVALAGLIALAATGPAGANGDDEPDAWPYHATADGLHPDATEQELLWRMNRARAAPIAEGAFLAGTDDVDVLEAVDFYQVDLALMQQEFAAIAPAPPAAFDRRLYAAAAGYAAFLVAEDDDAPACGLPALPPCQLERVGPAGFFFTAGGLRGNAFGFARSPLHAHAAWNVDWGPFPPQPPGMFPGRVHRRGVMSDPDVQVPELLTNVGIAALPNATPGANLGPTVVVANYANANTSIADHYDRFLVGTVWEDLDGDGAYGPGEGIPGVTVRARRNPWYAVTSAGGGYAFPVEVSGSVDVTFSGGGLAAHEVTREVGAASVLVDYVVPEPGGAAAAAAATAALVLLGRRRARSPRRP